MAITDLTGTTWALNSSLTSYAGGSYSLKTYVVNITTDTPLPVYGDTSDTFAAIAIGYDSGGEHNAVKLYKTYPIDSFDIAEIAMGEDTKSLPDPWQRYYSGTFTFTGGTDATNSALIDWVEDNCTEVVQPTIDVIVTYEGENIVELSNSGTKTLKTQGKYLTDDIMLEYVKSGGGGGGNANWELVLENKPLAEYGGRDSSICYGVPFDFDSEPRGYDFAMTVDGFIDADGNTVINNRDESEFFELRFSVETTVAANGNWYVSYSPICLECTEMDGEDHVRVYYTLGYGFACGVGANAPGSIPIAVGLDGMAGNAYVEAIYYDFDSEELIPTTISINNATCLSLYVTRR